MKEARHKGHISHGIPFTQNVQNRQRDRKEMSGSHSWEEQEWGATTNEYKVCSWGDENILGLDNSECCTTL